MGRSAEIRADCEKQSVEWLLLQQRAPHSLQFPPASRLLAALNQPIQPLVQPRSASSSSLAACLGWRAPAAPCGTSRPARTPTRSPASTVLACPAMALRSSSSVERRAEARGGQGNYMCKHVFPNACPINRAVGRTAFPVHTRSWRSDLRLFYFDARSNSVALGLMY